MIDEIAMQAAAAKVAGGVCPAPECHTDVAPGMLGCKRHWYQLPPRLRRLVNTSWALRRNRATRAMGTEEHEHWKTEAFRFWIDGTWDDPGGAVL